MNRIIAALIFCFMIATAVAIAVGARVMFDLPAAASILVGMGLLLVFALTQGYAVQRRNYAKLEDDMADVLAMVDDWHIANDKWNRRLDVSEERIDKLVDDRKRTHDFQARADISEVSALIKDMVDAIGDVDMRLQNHGRLLDMLPSQSTVVKPKALVEPSEHIFDDELGVPEEVEPEPIIDDAERIRALRRAINANSIEISYQSVVQLPSRTAKARYATAQIIVPGEDDPYELSKLASENGLMPCVDLLVLSQAARTVSSSPQDKINMICPLSVESLLPNPFSEAFEETLEAHRDIASKIILEFPDTSVTAQLVSTPKDAETTALRARLKRYSRWGYRYTLAKNFSMGLSADYAMLSELGFRYVRMDGAPLVAATAALERGERLQIDLHPTDFANLVGRYGMELIISGLDGEASVLDSLELNPPLGMGAAFGTIEELQRQKAPRKRRAS
ncbi:MAG: EAL domain-containing protein [Rhizobiales bacterium]|nr:EAL domain-containing protein [Hyphomicrobiales bacterium]